MTIFLDSLALIALIVWAAIVYNKRRKARWAKFHAYENTIPELHNANMRYYLDVYCGRQTEIDKLTHKPVPLN